MGNRGKKRRRKLSRGPSIMRVFGTNYKYKEELKRELESSRRRQHLGEKNGNAQIATERSVHAISTPFGGMNKNVR
jgi:hypothetical protein